MHRHPTNHPPTQPPTHLPPFFGVEGRGAELVPRLCYLCVGGWVDGWVGRGGAGGWNEL